MQAKIERFRRAGIYTMTEAAILLELADATAPMDTTLLSIRTNTPHSTAFDVLRRLEHAGLVEHRGTRPKPSEWILTRNGKELMQ
jgi:predicted transcriptional regulator